MKKFLWIGFFLFLAFALAASAFDAISYTDLDEELPNGLEGMLAVFSLWLADLGA